MCRQWAGRRLPALLPSAVSAVSPGSHTLASMPCLPSPACCQAFLNNSGHLGPSLLQLDGSHEERTFFMTRRDL